MNKNKPAGLIDLHESAAVSRATRTKEPDLPEGPIRQAAESIFKGGLLHTYAAKQGQTCLAHGKYIFVLTPSLEKAPADMQLFMHQAPNGLSPRKDGFTHACFTAGGPVHTAGEVWVYRGRPLMANNASGHYKPPARTLRAFTEHLLNNEVDIRSLVYIEQHLENDKGEPLQDQYVTALHPEEKLTRERISAMQTLEIQFEKISKMSTEAATKALLALQIKD